MKLEKPLQFPTRQDEDWKYLNFSALENIEFSQATLPDHFVLPISLPTGFVAVFINGHFSKSHSSLDNLPAGVTCQARENTSLPTHSNTVFNQLNAVKAMDGLLIHIAKSCQLKEPLHILSYVDTLQASFQALQHQIVLEENAALTVIEEYQGIDSIAYFNHVVTEITAGKDSTLQHIKLQCEGNQANHIANIQIQQANNSQVTTHHFNLGASLARDDLQITLSPKAENYLNGLYLAKNKQQQDSHTIVHHSSDEGFSQQLYKGIATDSAKAIFNGKVIVHAGTKNNKAHQSSQNLLLSKQAEINAKPELQIYADSVECSHGATIGELETQALFYLKSRGIPEALARIILLQGFIEELLEKISHPTLHARIRQFVMQHLEIIGVINE